MLQIQHDHHGVVVVLDVRLGKLHAQIDNRHDDAAQIGDALDKLRRVGDARDLIVAADLLHLKNIDTVLFVSQRKYQELLADGFAGDFGHGCHSSHVSTLLLSVRRPRRPHVFHG